ncbi:MAG TPA: NlpC/P60 family protein [Coriobacteriia bacterium]
MGRIRQSLAVSLALAIALSSVPAVALAAPVSEKRAQAVKIQAQINVLADKAEIATEDWNQAKIEYDGLHGKVVAITARLAANTAKTDILQTSLDVRADSMYRSGPLGLLDVLFGAASFEDFATTWDLLNEMNKQESEAVAELKVLRADALVAQADLKTAETASKKVYDVMADRRASILRDEATAKALLRGVEREIAALNAADRARRAADARAHGGGGGGTGWNWGNPAIAPRSGVVGIALRYLGHRYVWGASGPQTFDCSGFTMFVYAQVGVQLPHYSGAQINAGAHVSRDNLQPGDLVFFGSPIHHVGIYIGGGKMVHSPHTGDVVSIDPIDGRGFVGGGRP